MNTPHDAQHDAQRFTENLARAAETSQEILKNILSRNSEARPSPLATQIGSASLDYFQQLFSDPTRLAEMQLGWWQEYAKLLEYSSRRLLGQESEPVIIPEPRDKRFRDQAWQENAVYDFIKQAYLLGSRWITQSVTAGEATNPHQRKKLEFYTRQYLDAMAPSNFPLTNPEVLRTTLETGGENLMRGMENLRDDLEQSKGALRVSMTDANAFELGRNLATTPGKIVYENDLMQLIQYEPLTEKVHQVPILMIPAWINKYYILDLQRENSFVRFALEEGYTVFVISWVNPNAQLAAKSFDDYLTQGPLAALDAIEELTGETRVSAVGYCLGGTLLSITLAWLKANGESHRVASATYLTTMVDFREAGELSVFIDEEQLTALEAQMEEKGFLEGEEMSGTFNLLRANDLIWSFVVNNYLLGKDPFPFDLLYWNADSTRMPFAMHSYYLRNMYQRNRLIEPGGLHIGHTDIDLSVVDTPSYIMSTREDHIAPWKSTYAATKIYKGEVNFVLAASGHVAGVINPVAKNKYSFWVNSKKYEHPADWLQDAKETSGSWWPNWSAWQKTKAGPMVPARNIKRFIEPAPGRYASVKD